MPILDMNSIEIEKPELIFGLVAAVGTPLDNLSRIIIDEFRNRDYSCEEIRLSKFLEGYQLTTPLPGQNKSKYEEYRVKMNRGNELRQLSGGGEALALIAAAYINSLRPLQEPYYMSGKSFLLRQLKHPDEVYWLRRIYGSAFHLIGISCPESIRKENLINNGLSTEEAELLITRDEEETDPLGQHLRDTFYLADVFAELNGLERDANKYLTSQISRYFKLLFAEEIITPSGDEYGMHLAYTASLRSADLSRQVGAAILTNGREIISLGANEVPAPQGGTILGGWRIRS
jgi:hypothetical protein